MPFISFDMYTGLTGEQLRKAALIWQRIYFDEREVKWNGQVVKHIRLVDSKGRDRNVFDPAEEYNIRQDFELDEQDHLNVSFEDAEFPKQFYMLPKSNLDVLYNQVL